MADIITTPGPFAAAPSAENSRWRVIWRNAFPFLVVGAIWEIVARLGVFPPQLFPSLETVARGVLAAHRRTASCRITRSRRCCGCSPASRSPRVIGVAIGILMGRSRRVEDIFLPLVSIVRADPRHRLCAAVPAVVRARQLSGDAAGRFVSTFPIIFNTWTGVKAVKEIWVRSAQAMGADDRRLFRT